MLLPVVLVPEPELLPVDAVPEPDPEAVVAGALVSEPEQADQDPPAAAGFRVSGRRRESQAPTEDFLTG